MTDQQETILNKVKKLIALAGNNPSQKESEAAMMKAQELLSEHGLSMAQAESEMGVKQEACELRVDTGTKQTTWWHKSVAVVISRNFRCSIFVRLGGRHGSWIVFVGLPTDAEVASRVFTLAIETADREAKKFLRLEKARSTCWNRSVSVGVRNDYLRGWIGGLQTSFQKNVEERALVVVAPPEVGEYLEGMKLKKQSASRTRSNGNQRARSAGHTDGSRFNRRERLGS